MSSTLKNVARELRAVWMLLLVGVILSVTSPVFLNSTNLLNVGLATSVIALLAIGQTYVIVLAEIDLSVGATLGFTSVATALVLSDHGILPALAVGLGSGAAVGLVNGLLVTRTRMPSFIATLAMMSILAGLTLQLTSGNPVAVTDYGFQSIGQNYLAAIPVPVWIMIAAYTVFGVLLSRTGFGRYVYATGDNLEAARLSGIRTQRVKILAFVISGVLAALGGFILTARLSTAEPTAGTGLELESIAAVIIGGTSLAGGRGKLVGTLVGALVLGVIDNGMNLLDVSPFLQSVVKGLVILLAVFLDRNAGALRALVAWRPPAGSAAPEASAAKPEPGTPEPGTPEPGTPEPGTPEPGTPEPGTHEPGKPGSGDSGSGTPVPAAPESAGPEESAPQDEPRPSVPDQQQSPSAPAARHTP